MKDKWIIFIIIIVTLLTYKCVYGSTPCSSLSNCIYKKMVDYHGGSGKIFVSWNEHGTWYFYGKNRKVCKFEVPNKIYRKMVYSCLKNKSQKKYL